MSKKNPEFVEEFCTKPVFDQDGVQASAAIGLDGKEYGDPTPIAPPIGYNNPPPLMQMIKQMVHHELANQALDAEGMESFEEADDFALEDDPDFDKTDYERVFDPPPTAEPPNQVETPPSPPPASQPQPGEQGGGERGGVASNPPRVSTTRPLGHVRNLIRTRLGDRNGTLPLVH